jgi:NAD(P)H dehydrogenase (quinone)
MVSILVLYYSRNGSTRALAEQIAQGIESIPSCQAVMRTVPAVTSIVQPASAPVPDQGSPYAQPTDLQYCDGIALGSPTRFGNMADAMKHFWDQTAGAWVAGSLVGKPACVFTSTTSAHGGQEATLLSMMIPLLHHGALIVGIPYSQAALSSTSSGGSPYGATHHAHQDRVELTSDEIALAIAQGKRLASIAKQLKSSQT